MWSDAIWETPSQTNIIIQLVVISHLRKHEHYHQNKTLSQHIPSNIWELETWNITNLLGLQSRKEYFMLEQIWKWLHNRMYWKSIFIPTKSEPISFIFSLTKRITKLTSLSVILSSDHHGWFLFNKYFI